MQIGSYAGQGLRRGARRRRGAGGHGAGGVPAVPAGRHGRRLVGDAQADLRLHAARRGPGRGRRPARRRAGSIPRRWPIPATRIRPTDRTTIRRRWTRRSCPIVPGGSSGERDSDEARRPHAPGVWLIYFTLASLPLFGLGQWLVPAVEEDRRAWLFVYFLAYISSGMGLLLATSFLNLRRYLRRRKLKMPAAMTATWLSTGAILIVGLTAGGGGLAAARLGLSVPCAGPTGESSDLRASKYAVLKDSGVQGEGAQSEGPAASKAEGKQPVLGQGQGLGEDQRSQRRPADQRPGETGRRGGPGTSKSGAPKGKPASSQNGQQGKKGAPQDQSGEQGQGPRSGRRSGQGTGPGQGPGWTSEDEAEQGDEKGSEQDGREVLGGESGSGRLVEPGPEAAVALARRPGLAADADHDRRDRGRDLRPVSATAGTCSRCSGPCSPSLLAGLRVRLEEEAGEGRRRGRGRAGAAAAAVRLVRQPLRRRAGSSVHARRPGHLQLRGPRSLGLRARPGPLAPRDADGVRRAGSARRGPTSARTPRDWSATSSRSSTASAASGRRSCRRSASSGVLRAARAVSRSRP